MNDRQFGELVGRYERLVYSICYQFTHDHHTAQDLAQETFLSAYSHIDSCPPDNTKPWLARIAANKAKDYLKSAYKRRVFSSEETALAESRDVLFIREEQPEDIAVSRDAVEKIADDIRALKEPYHRVAVMYFLEEKTVEQISELLKRPPKTVHTQIWRARQALQKVLNNR